MTKPQTHYSLPQGIRTYCKSRPTAVGILRSLVLLHPGIYLSSSEIKEICIRDGYYDDEYLSSLMWLANAGYLIRRKYRSDAPTLHPVKVNTNYWQVKDNYIMGLTEYLGKASL